MSGARVSSFAVWLTVVACHPQALPAPASTTPRPMIAQRCPELITSHAASSAAVRAFVEIAQLTGDIGGSLPSDSLATPTAPFDDPRLAVQRVGHVIVSNDEGSTLAWDTPAPTPLATSEPQRWDLQLVPHFEGADSSSLRIELDLAPAPPLGTPPERWSIPKHRRVHTTVVLGEQQSVVLALPRGAGAIGPSLMVVTPYFIREEADLRRLFLCKMRARPASRPG